MERHRGHGGDRVLATAVTVPLGLPCGLFLAESDGRIAAAIRFVADVMTGVPSITIGIFGYIAIVQNFGYSGLAGAFGIGIIMLPVIIRAGETAFRGVPTTLNEAALALGARKATIARRVVVPTALPGVITGVLLAVARGLGETAPLLLTIFGNQYIQWNPTKPMEALPLVILQQQQPALCRPAPGRLGGGAAVVGGGPGPEHRQPGAGRRSAEGETMIDPTPGLPPLEEPSLSSPAKCWSRPAGRRSCGCATWRVAFDGRTAVRDVTFDVYTGEITALIGPSGSGKTTLLRALNRMHDTVRSASVTGHPLGRTRRLWPPTDATLLRSRVGMVFQRPNPFPTMSIYENAGGRTPLQRDTQEGPARRSGRIGPDRRRPVGQRALPAEGPCQHPLGR